MLIQSIEKRPVVMMRAICYNWLKKITQEQVRLWHLLLISNTINNSMATINIISPPDIQQFETMCTQCSVQHSPKSERALLALQVPRLSSISFPTTAAWKMKMIMEAAQVIWYWQGYTLFKDNN